MMKVYGIKSCGSVKKALNFLKSHEIVFEFIDFKVTPVDEVKIKEWLENVSMERLLNTKGTTYRTLKLKEMNLNDEQKIEWMAKANNLIKRPVIEYDGGIEVGFDEALYSSVFL
ncbi:MAG: Spx/MgsR family RNA polymerase-binding regulatory protein [Sulfurovum sp.]|nr:MAG: Spx/MgsR family RNA polymerase-binding regulatory protein [Sulfurovum sp.]